MDIYIYIYIEENTCLSGGHFISEKRRDVMLVRY